MGEDHIPQGKARQSKRQDHDQDVNTADDSLVGFIIDHTYRVIDGQPKVYLFGRLENGESFLTISDYKPFFYFRASDRKKAEALVTFTSLEETELKSFIDEPVLKATVAEPKFVSDVRKILETEGIPCYEADVRFTQRFLMEHDILSTLRLSGPHKRGTHAPVDRIYENPGIAPADKDVPLKVLSIDLEASSADPDGDLYSVSLAGRTFTAPDSATGIKEEIKKSYDEVLFISNRNTHDSVAREKILNLKNATVIKDEKTLLEQLRERIINYDPDIITGWNVIDFDFAFLKKKCDEHMVEFSWGRTEWPNRLRIESSFFRDSKAEVPGRMVLDGIHLLKSSFINLDDYKLGTAAHELLGEEKLIGQENKLQEIIDAYEHDPQKLMDYNLKDSQLVLDILAKKELIELTVLRSKIVGLPMERVRASIASLDSLYLRELHKVGHVAPSGSFQEKDQGITGGYVKTSAPGIYDWVIVLDFKSLYPSVMRTFNIDPLDHRPGCKPLREGEQLIKSPNGTCFVNGEGILPHLLQMLWEQRDAAKKRKDLVGSQAFKILMNSFFGVMASPNCRFFSMELANAITHFAQYFIKLTIERLEEQKYRVIYGDSITADRPIIIKKNGLIEIIPIETLFENYAENVCKRGNKEIIIDPKIETLSFNPLTQTSCFKPIKEIIRHKTKKKIFRVNQKYGETRCTEDHSLIREGDFREIRPQELDRALAHVNNIPKLKQIREVDLFDYLRTYTYTSLYKGREKTSQASCDKNNIWFSWTNRKEPVVVKRKIVFPSKEGDALLRLLGFFVAEGSSSTPETTSSRWGATIAGTRQQLERYKKDYLVLFSNTETTIIPSQKKKRILEYETEKNKKKIEYFDNTHKLNMMNQLSAVFFKTLAGQKSTGKKIPSFIYHLPQREQKIFLEAYLEGDGSREKNKIYSDSYRKKHFRCTTQSTLLASGFCLLLKQLGLTLSIRYRPSKKVYTIASSDKNNARLNTKVVEEHYEGFVYDLAVADTHLFADACGQILLHNTDSVFVNLDVKTAKEAEEIGLKIQEEMNAHYKKYIMNEYDRESYLELEFEKTYKKFLMPRVRGSELGAKKRYAGLLVMKDGEKMDFTGLEFVRRDWTELSKEFQLTLLNKIFHEEPVEEYVKNFVKDLKAGKYDDLLVYRKAVRKDLDGYVKTTPPHVKAARKLVEITGKLTTNLIEYVLTTNGPEPVGHLTGSLDYDHYLDKQVRPIADAVLCFFDTNLDDLMKNTSQMTLGGF